MNFLDRFSKEAQISSFIKIRPVGAELFHADGRTDGRTDGQTDMKLTVAFRNLTNAPKKPFVLWQRLKYIKLFLFPIRNDVIPTTIIKNLKTKILQSSEWGDFYRYRRMHGGNSPCFRQCSDATLDKNVMLLWVDKFIWFLKANN